MTHVMAVRRRLRHESPRMRTTTATVSLLPREKGAWGQALLPVATALVLARGSGAALAWGVAAVASFFSHEPVLVILGGRGDRTRREAARRALVWTAVCGVLGLSSLGAGLAVAPTNSRLWLALPLILSLASLVVLSAGRERTTPGEVLAASAVSSWIVPMTTAASLPTYSALRVWIAYVAAFTAATFSVRGVLDAFKHGGRSILRTVARFVSSSLLVAASLAWLAGQWPGWMVVALAPTLVLSLALSVWQLHPRQLRTVGWSLMATTAFLAIVVTAAAW